MLNWCCIAVFTTACAEYPSTYPFEGYELVDLPEATPSLTFDQSDNGGYMRLALFCNLDDYADVIANKLFHTPWHCQRMRFYITTLGIPDVEPPASAPLNCSRDGYLQDAAYLSEHAVSNGVSYECAAYAGLLVVVHESMQTTMNGIMSASSCPEPPEPFVCLVVFRGFPWCYDQYLSPVERLAIMPCIDIVPRFLETCNIFLPLGNDRGGGSVEPAQYWDLLSVEQTITAEALWYDSDRICYPYSYYFPDGGMDTPTSDDTDIPPSDDSASEGSDSAAIYLISMLRYVI